jgi:hypothetical protein
MITILGKGVVPHEKYHILGEYFDAHQKDFSRIFESGYLTGFENSGYMVTTAVVTELKPSFGGFNCKVVFMGESPSKFKTFRDGQPLVNMADGSVLPLGSNFPLTVTPYAKSERMARIIKGLNELLLQ